MLEAAAIVGAQAPSRSVDHRAVLDMKDVDGVVIGSPATLAQADAAGRAGGGQGRVPREVRLAHDRGGRGDGEGGGREQAHRPDRHPAAQPGPLHPGGGAGAAGEDRHHQLHPRLLVPERRQPEVSGVEARQAGLEALHGVGEAAPGDARALLQVALVLGLRRRAGVRAADPLDRRGPLVHRKRGPADGHRPRRPPRAPSSRCPTRPPRCWSTRRSRSRSPTRC